ncbi:hypothetical protein F4809DRAFT_635361 [Biscogniauxia mediterranea]|nr:hypothetical protein F4809DRAFT_635361 [Biscogniauxia mediterranea]
MNKRSVSELGAKDICSSEIRKYVDKYCHVVEKTQNNPNLSRDLRAYIEAVMYNISGNLVWSIYCPRYHKF